MKSYLYFLFLCTAPCAALALVVAACTQTQEPKTYRTYYVPGGQVQCAEAFRTNCGFSLRDCTLPLKFDCIVNIATEAK